MYGLVVFNRKHNKQLSNLNSEEKLFEEVPKEIVSSFDKKLTEISKEIIESLSSRIKDLESNCCKGNELKQCEEILELKNNLESKNLEILNLEERLNSFKEDNEPKLDSTIKEIKSELNNSQIELKLVELQKSIDDLKNFKVSKNKNSEDNLKDCDDLVFEIKNIKNLLLEFNLNTQDNHEITKLEKSLEKSFNDSISKILNLQISNSVISQFDELKAQVNNLSDDIMKIVKKEDKEIINCIPFITSPYGVKYNYCNYNFYNGRILSLDINVTTAIVSFVGERLIFPYGTSIIEGIDEITFNVEKLDGTIETRTAKFISNSNKIKIFNTSLDDIKRIFI